MNPSWWYLLAAGFVELGFTTCLRLSKGYTELRWIIGLSICALLSLALLNRATQTIPMGTAYAVWTALGAFGTVLIGVLFFREPLTAWRMVFLTALILSVVGLKFVSTG